MDLCHQLWVKGAHERFWKHHQACAGISISTELREMLTAMMASNPLERITVRQLLDPRSNKFITGPILDPRRLEEKMKVKTSMLTTKTKAQAEEKKLKRLHLEKLAEERRRPVYLGRELYRGEKGEHTDSSDGRELDLDLAPPRPWASFLSAMDFSDPEIHLLWSRNSFHTSTGLPLQWNQVLDMLCELERE